MKLLKSIALMFAGLCLPLTAHAQIANVQSPPPDPRTIPLYPREVGSSGGEVSTMLGSMAVIRNITRPTLTPILPPPGKATGAAVILAPGGGMIFLSMPSQDIVRRLTRQGIAVFVLKYRVAQTPREVPELTAFLGNLRERAAKGELDLSNPDGHADAQAAVALVRANAAKWHVDPKKVGLLGFSSGAGVSRSAALSDKSEGRPDFVGLIYGAMESVAVPATAPPMFAAVAIDDMIVPNNGFPVVEAWRMAKRPVELHAYQTGGHGFVQGGPAATHHLYLNQFMAWMTLNGFLPSPPAGVSK